MADDGEDGSAAVEPQVEHAVQQESGWPYSIQGERLAAPGSPAGATRVEVRIRWWDRNPANRTSLVGFAGTLDHAACFRAACGCVLHGIVSPARGVLTVHEPHILYSKCTEMYICYT